MAKTYEQIASTTLGSDTASYTFSGIAADWTDLILVGVSKLTNAGTGGANYDLRFNGDTGSNYSSTYVQGNGSAAGSGRTTSFSYLTYTPSAEGNATAWGVGIVHIMSYASTNVYKTALSSGASPVEFARRSVGLWRNTAAITSITVLHGGGLSLKAGSTFKLYGLVG